MDDFDGLEWFRDDGNFDDQEDMDNYFNNFGSMAEEDVKFLNEKAAPTTKQIIKVFISDTDKKNKFTIGSYSENELGKPDHVHKVLGTEWTITKLTWNHTKKTLISFLVLKTKISDRVELLHEDIVDIEFEDIEDDNLHYSDELYEGLLTAALNDEDYDEASKLRDWKIEFELLLDELKPLMDECFRKRDFLLFNTHVFRLNTKMSELYE
tara:strand:+ start:3324 stop:3953 length:630 start_codon:yes stop_codon:yes gene_type:complete